MHTIGNPLFAKSAFPLLASLLFAVHVAAASDSDRPPPSGSELMAQVRDRFPAGRIEATGRLTVHGRKGVLLGEVNLAASLEFDANPPRLAYRAWDNMGSLEESLTLRHISGQATPSADYARNGEAAEPPPLHTRIAGTDVAWGDLAYSFLWWTRADAAGRELLRNQWCHVVDAYPPERSGDYARVRLWIDADYMVPIRVDGFDAAGNLVRRMQVKSVKKVEEAWVVRDMEIRSFPSDHVTRLRLEEIGLADVAPSHN